MKDYADKQARSALFVLALVLILLGLTSICQGRSIDDLEQRVTTFETVAPPERVSP